MRTIILLLLLTSQALAFGPAKYGVDRWFGAAGAAAPTYTMTLAIPTSDSTLTVDGTPYTDTGSPHTIPGLSGLVNMVVTYGGTEDTTVFTGTDLADVLGVDPNFSIDMDADKSLICTFSTAVGDLEVGVTTVGSSAISSTNGHQIEIVVPSGGITASYGYVYGGSSAGAILEMGIYATGGTQVGACSTTILTTTGQAWYEVTFSTPVELSAGTYKLQYHITNGASFEYYRETTGTNALGNVACGTFMTTSNASNATMSVANYEAH